MVFTGSRYANDETYYDQPDDVTYLGFKDIYIKPDPDTDSIYVWRAGDRLDLVANDLYGDPNYQWIILYANPAYTTAWDIKAGDTLVIPSKARVIST